MSSRQGCTSPAVDVIIKFGGSAVTDKSQLETLNPAALQDAAKLVSQCLRNNLTCVVVHGAGSFGHHHAKQYQVNKGWSHVSDAETIQKVKRGLCLTRQSVTKLHHHVIEALLSENVPAVGLSFFSLWCKAGGELSQYNLEPLNNVLDSGLLPVLHGDCVFDETKGCAILSGDTIIKTISEHWTVGRVVFLTDVAGVYSQPPDRNPDAKLQTQLYVKNDRIVSPVDRDASDEGVVSNCQENDVTGGMTLKLQTAVDIVTHSGGHTDVYVCRLASEYGRQVCLNGQVKGLGAEGTRIQALPVELFESFH